MRVRAAASGIFASVAILGIGWQFGSAAAASFSAASSASANGKATIVTSKPGTTTSPSTTQPPNPSAAPPAATPAPPPPKAASGTYTGAVASTMYGDVQVEIVVAGGKITDVKALHLTDSDGRSVQISNRAAPMLRSEVLAAQSANVSGVSGATYTTAGYLNSVQSAIDKAGL